MGGITQAAGLDLGVPEEVKARTLAYLVVVLEGMDAGPGRGGRRAPGHAARGSAPSTSTCCPPTSGRAAHRRPGAGVLRRQGSRLRRPRRRRGPRAAIPEYLARVAVLAQEHGALIPAAATSATATSISRSSSPTTSGGTRSCTRCFELALPPGRHLGRARHRDGEAAPTSSRCRTRCRSSSCAAIKRAFDPRGHPRAGPAARYGADREHAS